MAGNPCPPLCPSVSCSPWTAVRDLTHISLRPSPSWRGSLKQQNLACNSSLGHTGVQRAGQGDRVFVSP